MKSYLKFGLLLVGLSLLLWQCQKDNFIETVQTEIAESIFKTNTVKLSDIPDIKDFLTNKSKTNIFNQKTIIDGAIFDQDNIMEVIDTLNRTNYSFRFTYTDTPKGVYYNLVVGKSPEGVLKVPYVLKYVTDNAYTDAFIENKYDFRFFKGTVGLHKFTDYFQQGGAFKTDADTFCPPEYDANGDPIACDNVSLDGSGVGSGGGGSGSDGGIAPSGDGTTSGGGVYGGIDSGSGSCTWTVTYEPCACDGRADGHGAAICGCGTGSPTILTLNCPGMYKMSKTNTGLKTSGTVDCPDCPTDSGGGVGVSLGDVDLSDLIINTLQLSLKDPKILWISTEATPQELLAITNFLSDNLFSVEAINLVINSIDLKLSYTSSNYPGINDGLPFKWWTDTNIVLTHTFFKVPSASINTPDETPNAKEAALFILFPEFSPRHIINARKALTEAQRLAEEIFIFDQIPLEALNDGKADAFRHAFWNALDTADFGSGITKMFTDAHEWNKTGLDVTMDLYNNNQGRIIGANYNGTTNDNVISDAVLDAVLTGLLKYIRNGVLIFTDN